MYPSYPSSQPLPSPVIARSFDQSRAEELADLYEEATDLRRGRAAARFGLSTVACMLVFVSAALFAVASDREDVRRRLAEAQEARRPKIALPEMHLTNQAVVACKEKR